MSFDYFSKNRVQYILTKLKDIFDTKANISDVPDTFADLTDVEITSPVSGQIPVYNPTTGKWVNGRRIIFSTADPAVNIGSELDVYIKISSNDYGKSFRVYTTSTGSENASIAVDTIISGEVTRTDAIGYRSPGRTYSDFTTNYYGGNWRVNITTDNVDGHPRGEEIAWGYYTSKNLSLTISPPIIYGVYIKSNGIWVNCKDTPISTFADLTDTAFTNLQNGQVAIYNSTTGKWENGNVYSANDGVLTIQKNGVDVQTFSANQSTNVTANITVPTTAADVGAIPTTQKGVASGVAELDSNGKVPSSQLPSYVDDTIEGYLYEGHWYSDAQHTQEVVGETGKIYVELSTNKTYRWSGTTFVEISESLALGETSSTAYRGDRGATAYSHATDANKVSTSTATGLYKVGATAEGHISELQAVQKSDITNLGIPGAVKLTITVSESEDPQTGDEVLVADKTPSEVLTALNGGMVVETVYEGRVCSIAQNLLSSAGRILFGVTVGGDNVGLFFNGLMFIKDSQDDAWESITLLNSNTTQRLNASIDYSNNTYSCDYTYDEFEDARSNGQEILVEYDDVIYYFTKYDSSEYTYYFSSTLADSDGTATNTFVMVGDDSTGDWDSITLTESSGGSASSFLVRVYEDPQTQQTTCDKLPSEILAAYTNGSIIQAKIELEGEDAMLDLASCMLSSSPYLVIFSTLVTRRDNDTVTLSLHLQKNSSSDTWEDIDIYQSDLCHYVGNISHSANGYSFNITPSMFDDAISYSLGARIKYIDSDNDVTYDFYLSRYDASDSEHTVFYLTSVNADSTGETTILTFALYPDWELDDWDNIVLYETNGSGDIIWTGTQAEYEAQASQIPVGAYVNITDDEQIIPYASAIRWEEASTSVKKNFIKKQSFEYLQSINTVGTWSGNTFVKNGITWTINDDGSVSATGTASSNSFLYLSAQTNITFSLESGDYILSGCPSGGSTSKYRVEYAFFATGQSNIYGRDEGEPVQVTLPQKRTVQVICYVSEGYAISDSLLFKPMIRHASVIDSTYIPYIPDNVELETKKISWEDVKTSVKKNYMQLNKSGVSQTINGITFTVNSDMSVTINGTATDTTTFYLTDAFDISKFNGMYLSGNPITDASVAILRVEMISSPWTGYSQYGDIDTLIGNYSSGASGTAFIRVFNGKTVNSVTIKPMIRLASVEDNTYVPYIPDNTELVDWKTNGILGAKNLVEPEPRIIGNTYSSNGISITQLSDGGVTINGTTSAAGSGVWVGIGKFVSGTTACRSILYPKGKYRLISNNTQTSDLVVYLQIRNSDDSGYISVIANNGEFTLTEATLIRLYIAVWNSSATVTVNNKTIYAMICLASDTDTTYQPYAMTNRQLTELIPVWSSSVTALTGATSVTITDGHIRTSSVIEPFADNGTNTAMSMPTMTVTEGQCVLGFDALTANTTFKLRITN